MNITLFGSLISMGLSTGILEAESTTHKYNPTISPNRTAQFEIEAYSAKMIKTSSNGAGKCDHQFFAYKNKDGSRLGPYQHENTSSYKSRKFWWARRAGIQSINRSTTNNYTKMKLYFRDYNGNFTTHKKQK